jgi:hypothetical protein
MNDIHSEFAGGGDVFSKIINENRFGRLSRASSQR